MKTNLSIAIIFLFALQLSAEKKPKLSISFEKRVAVFEAGESISINCKFRNRTSDTLEFEHSFGLISWEIYKGWKRVLYSGGLAMDSYREKISPQEIRELFGDPTAFWRFGAGVYSVKAVIRDKKGNIYKSNRINLIVKKGNRSASKAAKECYNGKTNAIKIQKSMAFLEKYEKSHLRDDIVIHMAKIFEKEKKYGRAIEVLTQFEQADFKTSVHQRNEAFSRIASNYKKLGKYDEAISYYKKSTYRYGPDMPYKTQIDYEILYLQRDIEEKKNQPYRISFEGGLNEFEMGEPCQ